MDSYDEEEFENEPEKMRNASSLNKVASSRGSKMKKAASSETQNEDLQSRQEDELSSVVSTRVKKPKKKNIYEN